MYPNITGIMACDPQGLIGKGNDLPWSYTEELAHFRRTVQCQTIIVGQKTFESTPRDILESCQVIVFSRRMHSPMTNCTIVNSLEAFLALPVPENTKMFMIGGAEIAHLFLRNNLIKDFILTKIHKTYEGDIFLDLSLLQDWPESVIQQTGDYTIYQLVNPNPIGGRYVH